MKPDEIFAEERAARIETYLHDDVLRESSRRFLLESLRAQYSYNFEWLSRPIIQYPQDVMAMQEVIWQVKPDLVIETGIAHGGSAVMTASMLALLDYCEAAQTGRTLDPAAPSRRVLAIDIDIRRHNRSAIEAHPLSRSIEMIEGSSVASDVVAEVHAIAAGYRRILVCLDSNHTREHVIRELEAYAPLVSMGSYCVVFDTVIDYMSSDLCQDRPWKPGDSPMTAVQEYLSMVASGNTMAADGAKLAFEANSQIDHKLLISVAPGGYLRRVQRAL